MLCRNNIKLPISEYVAFALIYISINYAHAVLKCTSLSP